MNLTSLPDLRTGTDKQIAWVNQLRASFFSIAQHELTEADLETLYHVRVTCQWWIDNKDKLKSTSARSLARGAKASVTRYGSVENAVDAQLLSIEKQRLKLERYRQAQEDANAAYIDEAILEELSEDRERPF